ncbi:MAG TPA: SsrA-binding protein SmpB [Candidatus Omnitrophota bacterium]|nr:SsrA-binding protein SmpB [Candidatus Omnitrophota bacterium]
MSKSMKKNTPKEVRGEVPKKKRNGFELIADNRKAGYNFFLSEKTEAGLCLHGHEVKSIRERRVNLKDAFVRIFKGEAFLFNCHISPYSRIQGYQEPDPTRMRKLLLNRREINKYMGMASRKGFAIVPTRMYLKNGFVKVEIALGEGKKRHDKRDTIKKRIHDRETSAAVKKGMRR